MDEPADPLEGSVVVFQSGETFGSLLEGFTLTGGLGTDLRLHSYARLEGGGVLFSARSSPRLKNCVIRGNSADTGGGLSCLGGSSPVLTRSAIVGNLAYAGGGGAYSSDSAVPSFEDCSIDGNRSMSGRRGLLGK